MAAAAESGQITTSFELDSSIRGRLTRALHEHIGQDIEVVYSESPDLLCGIELTISGHKLSWALADYLQKLDQHLQEQLDKGSGTSA
jgi:F-type H+-transporting ATPase subunit b